MFIDWYYIISIFFYISYSFLSFNVINLDFIQSPAIIGLYFFILTWRKICKFFKLAT